MCRHDAAPPSPQRLVHSIGPDRPGSTISDFTHSLPAPHFDTKTSNSNSDSSSKSSSSNSDSIAATALAIILTAAVHAFSRRALSCLRTLIASTAHTTNTLEDSSSSSSNPDIGDSFINTTISKI